MSPGSKKKKQKVCRFDLQRKIIGCQSYAVEKILDVRKMEDGTKEYKIKWEVSILLCFYVY